MALAVVAPRSIMRPATARPRAAASRPQRAQGRAGIRGNPITVGLLAAAILLAVLVLAASLPDSFDRSSMPRVTGTRTVRVRGSQSLWSIARENLAPGASVPETVRLLRRLNGLAPSQVVVEGSVLLVPACSAPDVAFASR